MSRNITDYFFQDQPFNLAVEMKLAHILGLIIGAPSVVGGIAIIVSAIFGSRQISPHTMLILSLCIGDAILGITQFVNILVHLIANGWETDLVSGIVACRIDAFFITQSLIISVTSLVLVALERYLVICRSLQNHSRTVVAVIAFQWLFALAISAIAVSNPDNVELSKTLINCGPNLTSRDPLMLSVKTLLIITIVISMTVISFCFYSIFSLYRQRMLKQRLEKQGSSQEVGSLQPSPISPILPFKISANQFILMSPNEKVLLFKMVVLTMTFITLLMPFTFAFIYFNFFSQDVKEDNLPLWFSFTYAYCLALNSTVNPFLLYYLDPGIKSQVNQFFGLGTKSKSTDRGSKNAEPPVPQRLNAMHPSSSSNEKDTVLIQKQLLPVN